MPSGGVHSPTMSLSVSGSCLKSFLKSSLRCLYVGLSTCSDRPESETSPPHPHPHLNAQTSHAFTSFLTHKPALCHMAWVICVWVNLLAELEGMDQKTRKMNSLRVQLTQKVTCGVLRNCKEMTNWSWLSASSSVLRNVRLWIKAAETLWDFSMVLTAAYSRNQAWLNEPFPEILSCLSQSNS